MPPQWGCPESLDIRLTQGKFCEFWRLRAHDDFWQGKCHAKPQSTKLRGLQAAILTVLPERQAHQVCKKPTLFANPRTRPGLTCNQFANWGGKLGSTRTGHDPHFCMYVRTLRRRRWIWNHFDRLWPWEVVHEIFNALTSWCALTWNVVDLCGMCLDQGCCNPWLRSVFWKHRQSMVV